MRALAALALLTVLSVAPALAQMSPGPLARPHAAFDSNTQCFQCHGAKGAAMDTQCLACHQEITTLRAAKRGLHASVAARACAKCHPDHGGRDFQMVVFEEGPHEKFDHRRAGYELLGQHTKAECRACHAPRNQKDAAVLAKMKSKDRARSWLGLRTECASCHADPHRAQLGAACQKCHTVEGWKPASGFDHTKTAFALTGKHARVECAKCHTTPKVATLRDAKGALIPQWKPLPHGKCSSCHSDPHAGRFGGECAKCHNTTDFKTISQQGFDHDRTRYPLKGRHAGMACAKCHDPKIAWGPKPKFGQCMDCHTDAHAGTATLAGKPADCASCHGVRGFQPSTFTVIQHQATSYPLEGGHASADCSLCHGKAPASMAVSLGPARVQMRPEHDACTDCHGDPHRGRFAAGGTRPRNEGCVGCHAMEHFSPSTLDVAAHARAAYALEGAHRAVPCAQCHAELKHRPVKSSLAAAVADMRPLLFQDQRRRCAECHESAHGTQFASRKDKGACESCHTLDLFAPAGRFDHDRDTAFKLEGAHAKAACADCHARTKDTQGVLRVNYRPLSTQCESCHAVIEPTKRSSAVHPRDPLPLLALLTRLEAGRAPLLH